MFWIWSIVKMTSPSLLLYYCFNHIYQPCNCKKMLNYSHNLMIIQFNMQFILQHTLLPPHKSIIFIHVCIIISPQHSSAQHIKNILNIFSSMLISSLPQWIFEKLMKFSIFLFVFIIGNWYFMWIIYLPIYMYMFVELFTEREKLLFFWFYVYKPYAIMLWQFICS